MFVCMCTQDLMDNGTIMNTKQKADTSELPLATNTQGIRCFHDNQRVLLWISSQNHCVVLYYCYHCQPVGTRVSYFLNLVI